MKKEIADYFKGKSTQEFLETIYQKEFKKTDTDNSPSRKLYKESVYKVQHGGNERGATWMHPLLFIDFAMWINPSFKYDVLKFVYDNMIDYRNKAGDAYKTLATNVQKLVGNNFTPTAMKHIGEAINWIIFNCHEKELRNKFGSEEKQTELYQFEIKVATLIDEGFITNYDDLINYLRNQYARRHKPF